MDCVCNISTSERNCNTRVYTNAGEKRRLKREAERRAKEQEERKKKEEQDAEEEAFRLNRELAKTEKMLISNS